MATRCILFTALYWLVACAALAQSKDPMLVLSEPLSDRIYEMATDSEDRFTIASFPNGSASLFSLESPEIAPRTFRLPLRNEEQRRERPVALSSDASLLAIGAPNGLAPNDSDARIYVLKRNSGRIVTVLNVPTRPQALQFWFDKSDGTEYLAAGLSDGYGVRVWDATGWQPLVEEQSVFHDCVKEHSHDLEECNTRDIAFNPDASQRVRLVVAGTAGIRFYDRSWQVMSEFAAQATRIKRIKSVAFSPDGKLLAIGAENPKTGVGGYRSRCIDDPPKTYLLSLEQSSKITLLEAPNPEPKDPLSCELARVAWSRDGRYLFGGGRYFSTDPGIAGTIGYVNVIVRWDIGSCGIGFLEKPVSMSSVRCKTAIFPAGTNTVMDINAVGQSGFMFGTQEPLLGGYSDTGIRLAYSTEPSQDIWREPHAIDIRNFAEDGEPYPFDLSFDGTKVSLRPLHSKQLVIFDITQLTLNTVDVDGEHKTKPNRDTLTPRLPVGEGVIMPQCRHVYWGGFSHTLLGWKPEGKDQRPRSFEDLNLEGGEPRDASFVTIDGIQRVVLGASRNLQILDCDGKRVAPADAPRAISEEAFRVAASKNGQFIVVGHSDGVLRWYDTGSLELILSLYIDKDLREWIAWLPNGTYESSIAGEALLGWVVNTDDADPIQVEYIPSHYLAKTRRNPDAIRQVITNWNDGARSNEARPSSADRVALTKSADDHRRIINLAVHQLHEGTPKTIEVVYEVERDANELSVIESQIAIDGVLVDKVLKRQETLKDRIRRTESVILNSVYASSRPTMVGKLIVRGESKGVGVFADTQDTIVANPGVGKVPPKPTVWGVFIGINNYGLDLKSDCTGQGMTSLSHAVDDAVGFKAFWENYQQSYNLKTISLVPNAGAANTKVSREDLRATLASIQKHFEGGGFRGDDGASKNNILIFYFSGHGVLRGDTFHLLASNADVSLTSPEDCLIRTSLTPNDFAAIDIIPGLRKIFVFDMCRESLLKSKVYSAFLQLLPNSEFIFSSEPLSSSVELASHQFVADVHAPQFDNLTGNGAFTRALIEALDGDAGKLDDPVISVDSVIEYVRDYLGKLAASKDIDQTTRRKLAKQRPVFQVGNNLTADTQRYKCLIRRDGQPCE